MNARACLQRSFALLLLLVAGAQAEDRGEVLQRVRENYVDRLNERTLEKSAGAESLAGLDEYSELLDEREYAELRSEATGAYEGIGVELGVGADGLAIVGVVSGSSAAAAGLKPGDMITYIDGNSVGGAELERASQLLRGPVGSSVRLLVRRQGRQLPAMQLQRSAVVLASVESQWLASGVAYFRVSNFTDATAIELETQLDRLSAGDNAQLRGVVLDLRGNPGGVLDAAIALADDFLDSGTIVIAKGHSREGSFQANARPGSIAGGAHMAVLINRETASAAEILAAALSENRRAVLVGTRTFGKGSVQSIIPLSGGGALKLTTSRYFSPRGLSIDGVGIWPEVSLQAAGLQPAPLDVTGAAISLPVRDIAVGVALQSVRARMRPAEH